MFVAIIIGLFNIWPTLSYADGNDHDRKSHDGSHHDSGHHDGDHHDGDHHNDKHGRSFIGVNFSFSPGSYYYRAPYYPPADNVFIFSPGYQPVGINGVTYYLNNGSYYVYNGYNYQPVALPETVIEQPVAEIQPPAVVTPAAPVYTSTSMADVGEPDSFTINIPNDKGGYTPVTLKESGNGYTGPQGEFYTEFPKVSQLKVIYRK